jgi:hypothetical protein
LVEDSGLTEARSGLRIPGADQIEYKHASEKSELLAKAEAEKSDAWSWGWHCAWALFMLLLLLHFHAR